MQQKRARRENQGPSCVRSPDTLSTLSGVLLASVYEYLNSDASTTAFFVSCHATAEAFQLAVRNETRVVAFRYVDRSVHGIEWIPFGLPPYHKFDDPTVDVYAGQIEPLQQYEYVHDNPTNCRRLIFNTDSPYVQWWDLVIVKDVVEGLHPEWQTLFKLRLPDLQDDALQYSPMTFRSVYDRRVEPTGGDDRRAVGQRVPSAGGPYSRQPRWLKDRGGFTWYV
jgi:hypothetical protein